MTMFKSLRVKIMLGFMGVLSISILCFGTSLFVAREFRTADSERVDAVKQLAQASRVKELVLVSQTKLSDYLRTGSAATRNLMIDQFSKLSEEIGHDVADSEAETLKVSAKNAVVAIDTAASASSRTVDVATGLGNPGAALGGAVASVGDADLAGDVAYLQFSLEQLAMAASRFAWTGDKKVMEAIMAETNRITQTGEMIRNSPKAPPGIGKKVLALTRLTSAIGAAAQGLSVALDNRDRISGLLVTQLDARIKATAEQQASANAHFAAATQRAETLSERLFATLVISTVIVAFAGITLAIMLGRSISRPILSLKDTIARMAGGDFLAPIPGIARSDEIGQMANAVEIFRKNGLRLKETELQAEQIRLAAEAERTRNDTIKAGDAAKQKMVVEAVAEGLERLSNGELVFRIRRDFPVAYEKLKDDFNGAMKKLQDAMARVSTNTAAIRIGAGEIASASDDLSRRTEQQAASLEESTAALKQITATVHKMSGGANQAREIVNAAKGRAEQSRQVVEQAIDAMGGMEKSAGEIGQIVSLIDEIAFQTNLLALNAGVEAARAGDAGRGFAVVASEVRALAQRSAEASREIKVLITTSRQQVDKGVTLVAQAGGALAQIAEQVVEINNIILDIAASTSEQATSLGEVSMVFNQMDQVTQQNAAMVEESTAASHALTRETEELSLLIQRFDVGQSTPARSAAGPRLRAVGRFG